MRGEGVLDVGCEIQCRPAVFDCLGGHTDDDSERVALPVVTGWVVHVDLVEARIDCRVRLFRAGEKDCLGVEFVVHFRTNQFLKD